MTRLDQPEVLHEPLPDFGPDTADAIVAAYVEERIEDFRAWLDRRGIPFETGSRQWLRMQKRRRAGFKAVTEALEDPDVECIGCGCTDMHACVVEHVPCHWLLVDRGLGIGVCSCCSEAMPLFESRRMELLDMDRADPDPDRVTGG